MVNGPFLDLGIVGFFCFGACFVFASAVAFAGYLLLTPPLIKKFGSWNFTGLALTVACIGALTHYALSTTNPIQLILQLPSSVIWYGVGLGFLVMGAAYLICGVIPALLIKEKQYDPQQS